MTPMQAPNPSMGGLGGLGGMPSEPAQDVPAQGFDLSSLLAQLGYQPPPQQATTGIGSGQWGSYGGNTSAVVQQQPAAPLGFVERAPYANAPRNGWGGPWQNQNPFSPGV